MKIVFLIAISFTQQAFTATPQPNALYTAIWPGEIGTEPVKADALICYTNVIGLPIKIANATKHVLKHMVFPSAPGQTVPRSLLCWIVPDVEYGRRNAETARSILSDLYNTGGAVVNINRLIGTIADHTPQQTIKFHSAIDAIVAYADIVKNRLRFPVDYEYQAGVSPAGIFPPGSLSPYEVALRDNEDVRRFIGSV